MNYKVVVNRCYGGFSLSEEAEARYNKYAEAAGLPPFDVYECPRHCPFLIQVVEEMGGKVDGSFSNLQIVSIEGNQYRIREYDGMESVETPESQTWITIN